MDEVDEKAYFELLGELNRRRRLDAKLRELRDLIDEILEEE